MLLLIGCTQEKIKSHSSSGNMDSVKKYNTLTTEEERVIVNKGTEKPFTGEFYKHKQKGTYICKRCDMPLYISEDKFDSGCGWPSFDDEIPGAVKRVPDKDGHRTEIICNNCGGHLGHVFLGEGFTEKNTRHCVNSISLKFIPYKEGSGSKLDTAVFASGCFWGVEYHFKMKEGVISTTVGYTGGRKDNPTYKEVCSGSTGHKEAIRVVFDPSKVSFEDLAKLYFETHDFTQTNGQGPDIGEQYLSFFYYKSDEQKSVVENLIKKLEEKGYKVATKLEPASKFWDAEDYHQDYYEKTGKYPYCHVYKKIFD